MSAELGSSKIGAPSSKKRLLSQRVLAEMDSPSRERPSSFLHDPIAAAPCVDAYLVLHESLSTLLLELF
jgi:hypothetical protein